MRACYSFLLLLFASLSASAAGAAPLTVRVVDAGGKPVGDAIVALHGAGAPAWRAGNERYAVSQKDLAFAPFVLLVPVGAKVAFPNFDPTRHHVYSFSAAKKFELKLFARDQTRSVTFDQPGIVALGCNIHDSMSAFVVVADNGWTARTDARGIATFRDAPRGGGSSLSVWHPFLRAPGNQVERRLSGAGAETVGVRLRPAALHDSGY